MDNKTIEQILLNPDFLKAYFGEELVCYRCGAKPIIPAPQRCVPDGIPYCPNCLHNFVREHLPPNLISAYKYHAHKILDLILDGENPLIYFDQFEEEE
ncbi:hypothetical protein [Candidatus Oleimmundimicrobium sp.]|uniref:hypothetical protein n=1 Tax=Candidatus Oleimmundimicrobium sp. TaxID=3060597 RepID=UPI0027241FDC|nr:hypothetical protein [Candidatus Oleimmundimicrobium sp.]MDO8885744.1 hypothetical protein [Candidatus Oleimmundimicrobium sp.]